MPGSGWDVPVGTPERPGNTIVPIVDGEAAWTQVHAAVSAATTSIDLVFWMMDLDSELQRPVSHTFKDPVDRAGHTFYELLNAKREAGVKIRILLWIPPKVPATERELFLALGIEPLNPFSLIRSMAAAATILWMLDLRILRDAILRRFDVILEPHPNNIGSWHQKTIVVDGRVAFVGGMNAKQNDWDTSRHTVFDYRRMPHSSTGAQRARRLGARQLPDFDPRHDLMTKIEGPLVRDVRANFVQRWNQAIADKRCFTSPLVPLAISSGLGSSGAGPLRGQIVRTMPRYAPTPLGESGCAQMYVKAIGRAEQYIYIEDQYLRSPTIVGALASAVRRNPKLILIIVTMPDYWLWSETAGLGLASITSYWTEEAYRTLAAVIPNFKFFTLKVSDVGASRRIFQQVDIHAKIMIVDDAWYTIGSCNINERGFVFEGELNVGVPDPAGALRLRRQLFDEHLELSAPADIRLATKLWYEHALLNDHAERAGTPPVSRVYPFQQHGPMLPLFPQNWW